VSEVQERGATSAGGEGAGGQPPSAHDAADRELLGLVLNTTDGLMDWDFRSGHIRYTDRWKLLLGYEPSTMPDSPTLWIELSHPADLPRVRELMDDHLENFWPFSHTWRMRHHSGDWRWISCRTATLRDPQMRPVRLVGFFSDITDRVRAEERQRALASAIPDLLLRIGADGLIRDVKAPERELAAGLEMPRVGQPLSSWAAAGPWHDQVAAAFVAAAGSTPRAVFETTLGEAERRRFVEVRIAGGSVDEAVCIIRDITDQRKMQSQLMEANKLESIGQLAAGIAHEINTPMQYVGDNLSFVQNSWAGLSSVIDAYRKAAEGARAAPVDPEVLEEVARLREEHDIDYVLENAPRSISSALEGVDRVARIVRAMKEFSHPGATEKTACDLNRELETTLTIARHVWKEVAEVTRELDPDLPPVTCHPGEINQVFLNLIVNAAHAIADVQTSRARQGLGSAADRGQITVSTSSTALWAEVRIADTGGGIPERIQNRIFDPFFTTKEVGRGTGQGLAIARSTVVDKHGGRLEFETEVGVGTTFIIRLPLDASATASE
jgi:PAS domain S-box-containing protein